LFPTATLHVCAAAKQRVGAGVRCVVMTCGSGPLAIEGNMGREIDFGKSSGREMSDFCRILP
jgi:hypothetical protein